MSRLPPGDDALRGGLGYFTVVQASVERLFGFLNVADVACGNVSDVVSSDSLGLLVLRFFRVVSNALTIWLSGS